MSNQEYSDVDRRIYEEELAPFLPEKIVDAHTHIWRKEFRLPEIPGQPAAPRRWPRLMGEENTIEHLVDSFARLFPDRPVTPLLFGKVSPTYDIEANNRYVAEVARRHGFPALCVTRPEWDAVRFENAVRECGNLGAKVYLSFAPRHIPPNEIRIFDFIPPHQLDVLHRNRWVLMLHIPRSRRLRDPVNLAQMIEIAQTFPGCKTLIAHIGRAYCPEDVGDAFSALKAAPGLYYDFSANANAWVMEKLIDHAGPDRILYGSDAPLCRLRMGRTCENGAYINRVPQGRYGDLSGDPEMREVTGAEAEALTLFTYETIRAFRQAARTTGLRATEIRAVFHDNAQTLFGISAPPKGSP